jgi:lauroyl/myristoyl acyltransferase
MKRRITAKVVQAGAPEYEGWIKPKDFITACQLLFCALAATMPQPYRGRISRLLARVHIALRGSKHERIAKACERYLKTDPIALELAVTSAFYEENIEAVRDLFPGGWRCEIELRGLATIQEALRRGRGAVLWISPFAHSDLVTKRALWAAGYPPSHLSHFAHPFSSSRLGARLLNPMRLRAENRYLEHRVFVSYGRAREAMDVLKQVLADNGVVTVTASGAGRKALVLPLLGGTIRLAMGAAHLALETRAALIPLHTVPHAGGYTVHCGPDLNTVEVAPGSGEMNRMAREYITLLEAFVREHPSHWRGWFNPSWQPEPRK